jgi:rhodanese-related sulfurtransferase
MSDSAAASRGRVQSVLLEAAWVAVAGGLLALLANALSPRGLQLSRNYFPAAAPVVAASANPPAATNATDRLKARNLQSADRATVEALTRDPRLKLGAVLVLDARNDASYQAGHIPGALQFDHYRAEAHLATVIPACLAAETIVIYCGGGTCEDSEFAAVMLRDAGIPNEKLFIYGGGIADWKAAKLPLEAGARFSGELIPPAP